MTMPIDDITTFLGSLPPEEHEARRRILTCRNAGSFKASRTQSESARALAWMAAETGSVWVYAPATVDFLEEVVAYLMTLLKAADQAECLEVVP